MTIGHIGDASTSGVVVNPDGTLDYSGTTNASSSPWFVTGIPDSPSCGPNPCGVFDVLGPSQECMSFVQCADPSDFSSWITGKGSLAPSLAAQAGSDVSGTINAFFESALGGDPQGGVNWTMLALLGAVGFFGFQLLTARR